MNFAKFLGTSFLLIEHLRMNAACVYLWIFRSFSEHFFYRAPLGNCLFHVKVAEFQPPETVKNFFTGAFQAFYKRTRSGHSKAFISLKSLKTICQEVICKNVARCQTAILRKKPLSHILLYVFSLHFLRMHHDYFYRQGFESVRIQFLSGNISGK